MKQITDFHLLTFVCLWGNFWMYKVCYSNFLTLPNCNLFSNYIRAQIRRHKQLRKGNNHLAFNWPAMIADCGYWSNWAFDCVECAQSVLGICVCLLVGATIFKHSLAPILIDCRLIVRSNFGFTTRRSGRLVCFCVRAVMMITYSVVFNSAFFIFTILALTWAHIWI